MSYGLEKYPSKVLREKILEEVDLQLRKNPDFGPSLARYGMLCGFNIDVVLYGRQVDQDTVLKVTGEVALPSSEELIRAAKHAESYQVHAEGTVAIGQSKPKAKLGSNVVEGKGISTEQEMISRERARRNL